MRDLDEKHVLFRKVVYGDFFDLKIPYHGLRSVRKPLRSTDFFLVDKSSVFYVEANGNSPE